MRKRTKLAGMKDMAKITQIDTTTSVEVVALQETRIQIISMLEPVLEVGRYAPVHRYILTFRVAALFCVYQHFWHVAGTQKKIVRVSVIRLYDPIYDYKWYRNNVKHTTQTGSPLISTHHMNERKQSRSPSLCGAWEGEAVSGETCE